MHCIPVLQVLAHHTTVNSTCSVCLLHNSALSRCHRTSWPRSGHRPLEQTDWEDWSHQWMNPGQQGLAVASTWYENGHNFVTFSKEKNQHITQNETTVSKLHLEVSAHKDVLWQTLLTCLLSCHCVEQWMPAEVPVFHIWSCCPGS